MAQLNSFFGSTWLSLSIAVHTGGSWRWSRSSGTHVTSIGTVLLPLFQRVETVCAESLIDPDWATKELIEW